MQSRLTLERYEFPPTICPFATQRTYEWTDEYWRTLSQEKKGKSEPL